MLPPPPAFHPLSSRRSLAARRPLCPRASHSRSTAGRQRPLVCHHVAVRTKTPSPRCVSVNTHAHQGAYTHAGQAAVCAPSCGGEDPAPTKTPAWLPGPPRSRMRRTDPFMVIATRCCRPTILICRARRRPVCTPASHSRHAQPPAWLPARRLRAPTGPTHAPAHGSPHQGPTGEPAGSPCSPVHDTVYSTYGPAQRVLACIPQSTGRRNDPATREAPCAVITRGASRALPRLHCLLAARFRAAVPTRPLAHSSSWPHGGS